MEDEVRSYFKTTNNKLINQMQITLIGTAHQEKGKCNSQKLFEILMDLNPEIIFEEMPAKHFNDYYVLKKRSKLESVAILKYKQLLNVEQIPIDWQEIPEKNFLDAYENIFKTVYYLPNQNGVDFRNLTNDNNKQTIQYGFEYLNSDEYSNV